MGGRLVGTASRLLDVAVGGLLIVVVAITLAQVVARYMLGTALIWSEEFTRLVHVWMVALAGVRAAHMRIEFFLDRMGRRTRLAAELLNEGVYAIGFFFPVVPKGQARIRTQMSAAHTPEQIERAADAFIAVGKRLGVIPA